MKDLTSLQKIAIDHLEMMISDVWMEFLNAIRAPENSGPDIEKLAFDFNLLKIRLGSLEKELDCRWAIDLAAVPKTYKYKHTTSRLMLIEDKTNPVPLKYNNYQFNCGTGSSLLITRLGIDLHLHLKEVFDILTQIHALENQIPQKLIDELILKGSWVDAVNDFIASRFGEDESGIVVFRTVMNDVYSKVYQASEGPFEPIRL